MNRKTFLELIAASSGILATHPLWSLDFSDNLKADVVIAGGGLGGCAAAFSALRNNLKVILTEETDWIGGQLTQQGVPPDEHGSIETHGSSELYRFLRRNIRKYYKNNYPVTNEAEEKEYFNPGDGSVSRLCHEPKVALAVLYEMFAPYISSGKLVVLLNHKVIKADMEGSRVRALEAQNVNSLRKVVLSAPYFVDATELGELLPLTNTEFVTGTESRRETGELHAPEVADPQNNQAFTMCFAMDYIAGENNTIDKPEDYDFWRSFEPKMEPPYSGKMLDLVYTHPSTLQPKALGFSPVGEDMKGVLNLWNYRRIINKNNFKKGTYKSDITIVNWPQNDYVLGDLISADKDGFEKHINQSKQQSLSLLYWLQTEVPRLDGGRGWPGLRLRKDIMGTADGMAKYPYVRESRRIKALFTILEEHVGRENRAMVTGKKENKSADFFDTVGIGYYHIDLHPSSNGDNYIDFSSLPFQIPLGALIPVQTENLLPANKNIGTTHITNGCYRLHPVEWCIGESVGMLVSYALEKRKLPRQIRADKNMLGDFQSVIRSQGIETHWPES